MRKYTQELLDDISDFKGEDIESVIAKVKDGVRLIAEEWLKKNPKTDREIKDFYKRTENYIYDLALWHVTTRRGFDIQLLLDVRRLNVKTILDFGCGIGQNSIMLAREGYDVTMADLKSHTLDFAKHRFTKHKIPHRVWQVDVKDMPPLKKYDVIISYDVLEHLPKGELKAVAEKLVSLKHKKTKVKLTATYGFYDTHPMHMRCDDETRELIKRILHEVKE